MRSTISRRRRRSRSESMRRDTPTRCAQGVSTRWRPAIETWEVMRAPLVPIGSLATWTRISWPSSTRVPMSGRRRAAGRCGRGAAARRRSPSVARRCARCPRRSRRRRGRRPSRGRCRRRRPACPGARGSRGPSRRSTTTLRVVARSMWRSTSWFFSRIATRVSPGAGVDQDLVLHRIPAPAARQACRAGSGEPASPRSGMKGERVAARRAWGSGGVPSAAKGRPGGPYFSLQSRNHSAKR